MLNIQYSVLLAWRQTRVDLMTFQTIDEDERTSKELQPLKITLVKFTYPGRRPKIPSLSHLHYGSW